MTPTVPPPLPATAKVFCVGGPVWTTLVATLRPGARLAADPVGFAEGFADESHALALIDLGTPWADGIELALALRRRHPALRLVALGAPAGDALLRFAGVGFAEAYASSAEGITWLATRLASREVAAEAGPSEREQELERELATLRTRGDRRFAAEVAHDLREPLRTHRLLLERVESQLALGDGEAAAGLLARLYDATARMEELIDGSLAALSPAAGTTPAPPSSVDRVLDEVLDQLSALIEETGARVDRGPLPEVGVEAHTLRQLLQNLLVNAIRHGGNPPRAHVSARRDGDRWRLMVRDWGEGVPAADRETIFRPLARLVGSAPTSGHGLGLAICRKLAERAGGSIEVGEAEGGGAVFTVSLPSVVGDERTDEMRLES